MNNKIQNKNYISAIGRRKSSSALVRIYKDDAVVFGGVNIKKGDIVVNGKSALDYFGKILESRIRLPLKLTNSENKFSVSVKATGGGKKGQMDAMILGLARALKKHDKDKFHLPLKRRGLLTRDARVRERRKVGMGGKSRRRKQSPKR